MPNLKAEDMDSDRSALEGLKRLRWAYYGYETMLRALCAGVLCAPIIGPADAIVLESVSGRPLMRNRIGEACHSIADKCVASDNLMSCLAMRTPKRQFEVTKAL
jgi:hypothetical protein